MIPAEAVEAACTCAEAFGQTIYSSKCQVHNRCTATMRGIPIQCILVTEHRGDHK